MLRFHTLGTNITSGSHLLFPTPLYEQKMVESSGGEKTTDISAVFFKVTSAVLMIVVLIADKI